MKIIQLQTILAACLLSSCVTNYGGTASAAEQFVLSRHTTPSGTRVELTVSGARGQGVTLTRIDSQDIDLPYLGIQVRLTSEQEAERHGLEEGRGLWVTEVVRGSAAWKANFRTGDILLSLNGEDMNDLNGFRQVMTGRGVAIGQPTEAVLLRDPRRDGELVEFTTEAVLGKRTVDENAFSKRELETLPEILDHTGMQVATLDAETVVECGFGEASQALVVAVVSGSAAYDSGIRSGDRILECNGESVSGAADVLSAVRKGGDLDLFVDGPLGEHRAKVNADRSVDARGRWTVPLIYDHKSDVTSTRTSFLDIIFQFGFNYSRSATASQTREPSYKSNLSILPLGMFEFDRQPGYSHNRLFWFITWTTRD